ncbi:malonyl-CoA:anthocyanidin 5-O-glucoside-6''-O-malonyltransferase-like, partial [Carica papaya]|uniref:malonyl-CoA:anthocyanidin 5-O-glucoside-6''-O-malonyltransferase-like n=1 Tax=Carica papaya TaxID=3649 RepID=UPI000B8C6F6C
TLLSSNQTQEATNLHPLVPELSISDYAASTIALQVTLFPGQGFSIGITAHHAVLDGNSSTMFMKSWAYICKQDQVDSSLPQELTPLLDRRVIKDPTGRETSLLNRWSADPSKRNLKLLKSNDVEDVNLLVRGTFELTREDIKKLREKIQKESNQPQLHLSSFVITCAYVLVCMVKARSVESDDKDVSLGFPADYRIRLNPPVPLNYFGNCVGLHLFVGKAVDFLGDQGIAMAAEKVSNVVKELENGELFEKEKERISMFMGLRPGALVVKVAARPGLAFTGRTSGGADLERWRWCL